MAAGIVPFNGKPLNEDHQRVSLPRTGVYLPLSLLLLWVLILKTKIKDLGLSFSSAKSLRNRVELLPSGPRWLSREVSIPGFATKDPLTLYYRDPIECMGFLLQNPIFAGRIHFSPKRHYDVHGKRTYGDWITSDGAWEMQVCEMLLRVEHS
jgi:hypothetical protein